MAESPTKQPAAQSAAFTQEAKERIVKALTDRGVNAPCPRCGNNTFFLLDGYFRYPLEQRLGGATLHIGGPAVPAVVTGCERCGFLASHAVGALGMLDEDGKNES